jgi:hypothetical protein
MSFLQQQPHHVGIPRFAVYVKNYSTTVGIFDSFDDAVAAIRESLGSAMLKCWTEARIVVHDSHVHSIGTADAWRAFRADGTAYTPDMFSEETIASKHATRAQRARWTANAK